MYLDYFVLPTMEEEESIASKKLFENGGYLDNGYPCGMFPYKGLSRLDFDRTTILYGGNGSGKTTLLNIIANKLNLHRIAPYNDSELFGRYVAKCSYKCAFDDDGKLQNIPSKSAIITSDDIFEYMFTLRENNSEIEEGKDFAKQDWLENRYGKTVQMKSIEDYEQLRTQVLARRKSVTRRKYMQTMLGKEVKLNSNGETALDFFEKKIMSNTFYCLDEPENSLSPQRQQMLVEMLEYKGRYEGCQFVISTHSPFILAMNRAKIFDLDASPVDIKKWYQLENVKYFYQFFLKHAKIFADN